MTNTKLMPMVKANGNLVDEKSGEVTIKYMPGYPRQIRFDASRGMFNVKGEIPLTKKGEEITILPLAYRIFSDDILGMGKKAWVEFFFLNNSNQMCALLLHGYSVQNLMRQADEMFYDDVTFCDVALTIKPIEKTSTKQDEQGKFPKYYMCEFGYKKLDKQMLDTLNTAKNGLHIWRVETHTGDAEISFQKGYNPPVIKDRLSDTTEPEAVATGDKTEPQAAEAKK